MKLEIIRLSRDAKEPQFGVMLIEGAPSFVTLELPYMENRQGVSCIPIGVYRCFRRPVSKGLSADIGEGFEIEGVVGRSDILIHVANTTQELKGCIALGSRYGSVAGVPAILGSREAYRSFMKRLDRIDRLDLTIDSHEFSEDI